ncbi:GDP-mannose transporter GONST2 [Acorus gramineus]|uniref:GDP-mannose transporter GONST2 n=1 Tax=Acorus gramineus TaxID=55184 RepID=A0AAV9B2C5_ACOGR|nr:GDP-mannose transporter GONST2 [Acorus gramineus]
MMDSTSDKMGLARFDSRSSDGDRGTFVHDVSLPTGQTEKPHKILEMRSGPLLSGIAYCISSCSMILLNKVVLSSYGFNAGISLMLYQLTLRRVMDTAKQSTTSGSLNEVSMVLLNNSLSLPFGILLILLFNEWDYVYRSSICWGIFRKGEDELAVV